jgi:hypothetical protein
LLRERKKGKRKKGEKSEFLFLLGLSFFLLSLFLSLSPMDSILLSTHHMNTTSEAGAPAKYSLEESLAPVRGSRSCVSVWFLGVEKSSFESGSEVSALASEFQEALS